jgi:hypothetical protein
VKDSAKYIATILRVITFFRPLRVYLPVAALLLLAGLVFSVGHVVTTGTLQESDIILVTSGVMVGMMGLLAELIVSQRRA